jgi:hypothetical protein
MIFRSKEDQKKRKQEEIARMSRQYDPGNRKPNAASNKPLSWTSDQLPEFDVKEASGYEFEVDGAFEE